MENQSAVVWPRYRCYKEVWALKIKAINPLLPPPCKHPYGLTTCGYGPNVCMHAGSDSETVPPLGRHVYAPADPWPYGMKESAIITPEDGRYAPFAVDDAYVQKHNPQAGGYFVVYADGYKSFSPSQAFEEGYTLIS